MLCVWNPNIWFLVVLLINGVDPDYSTFFILFIYNISITGLQSCSGVASFVVCIHCLESNHVMTVLVSCHNSQIQFQCLLSTWMPLRFSEFSLIFCEMQLLCFPISNGCDGQYDLGKLSDRCQTLFTFTNPFPVYKVFYGNKDFSIPNEERWRISI